ncbi:MAG: aminotransferase class IV [Planctomycetota bacterium]
MPADAPIASLGGRLMSAKAAALPLDDALITGGAAVTERLRTFGGVPFAVDRHLDRLQRSADAAFIPLPGPREELKEEIDAVVRHNVRLCEPGEELSVGLFVSAGSPADGSDGGGSVAGVTTTVLPADRFIKDYEEGVQLVVPATRQIPAACLDPRIKTRSRLHWRIAATQAAAIDPLAKPLLLHLDGTVAETDTGNVLCVGGRTIRTPPAAGTLDGVTRAVTRELAERCGFAWREEPLTPDDLCDSDEALIASTTPVLWPVVRMDGRPVGAGTPGRAFRELIAAWERHVGRRFASKPSSP